MQRPIKFRAWDSLLNKFIKFDLIGKIDFSDQTYVFQQFIGIKDSNAQEIYEGDIIEFDETQIGGTKGIGEVIYDTDMTLYGPSFQMWVIEAGPLKDGETISRNGIAYFPFNCKVIGNIFENPELLK